MLAQPDGSQILRDVTPCRFDATRQELQIEIALHGHGPASRWAAQAAPGQSVVIGGPRGSMIIPTDFDWHLLAGDSSALPAIVRRLRELPGSAFAKVLLQVEDALDERELESAARLQVCWVHTSEQWLHALRELTLPDGEGFAWLAAEARAVARAREILLSHHGHPLAGLRAAAYWKLGATAHHERLDG
jgi:NADPH-dependent ferric siderophore reductase